MFNHTLQSILKRQKYIDQLNHEQISTIKTKQLFFKALQQTPLMDPFNSYDFNYQKNQSIFKSNHMDSPSTNLLKHILPAQENSYEEIQQLQNRLKLFNQKKLNQVQIIKQIFQAEKQQIFNSGLNVSDFLQIYQSQDMQNQQKDINDPLIKKITAYFQTNTKQHSFYDLMKYIIQSLTLAQTQQQPEQNQFREMRKLRQSVISLQGLNINLDDNIDNQFNQQTKKQMDKLLEYYRNVNKIFDIQNQQ